LATVLAPELDETLSNDVCHRHSLWRWGGARPGEPMEAGDQVGDAPHTFESLVDHLGDILDEARGPLFAASDSMKPSPVIDGLRSGKLAGEKSRGLGGQPQGADGR
jgi:hypothetical protein